MRFISDFVVRTSTSPWLFLMSVVLGPLTLIFVLLPLMQAFSGVTAGVQPFDWQPDLTAEQIEDQVSLYTDAARNIYLAHTFIDFLFPVFFGTFFGAIAAFFLRKGSPDIHMWMCRYGLYGLFLLTALFDLLENVGAVGVVWSGGAGGVWSNILLFGKGLKLIAMQIIPLMTVAGVLVGAGVWLWSRFRGERA